MQQMKNPCIVLDSVTCQARYSGCRMLCPKEMYPFCGEIWLEIMSPSPEASATAERPENSLCTNAGVKVE